jgi:clan AA aspartic protease
MGLVYADIELINPKEQTLRPMKINALVDTGAITLCIPEHIVLQLKLEALEQREVTTADGNEAVVNSGLQAGQQVVVAGVHVLSPGQKVTLFQPVGSKP